MNTKEALGYSIFDGSRNELSLGSAYQMLINAGQNATIALQSLGNLRLTNILEEITFNISDCYHVDNGLILLSLLAYVSALDMGAHKVVMEDMDYTNNLSIIVIIGAEWGYGKSHANKIFDECLAKLQDSIAITPEAIIKAKKQRCEELSKKYARSGDEDLLKEIQSISDEIKQKENKIILKISDCTIPAYMDLMESQGFVPRIDPDGSIPTKKLQQLINKFWSGEAHFDARISRKHYNITKPYAVELILTQPEKIKKMLFDENTNDRGYIARSLIYQIDKNINDHHVTPQRSIDKKVIELIEEIFKRIFKFAREHRSSDNILRISQEAMEKWSSFETRMKYRKGNDSIIGYWQSRMAQNALRIAGLIHLIEHDDPMASEISLQEIEVATEIVETVYNNIHGSILNFNSNNEAKCFSEIGLYILENNIEKFNETDMKQKFKHKYDAKTIEEALNDLHIRYVIDRVDLDLFRRRLRGRPAGSEFRNRYYQSHVRLGDEN